MYSVQMYGDSLQTFSLQQTDGEYLKSRIIYPTTSSSAHNKCFLGIVYKYADRLIESWFSIMRSILEYLGCQVFNIHYAI